MSLRVINPNESPPGYWRYPVDGKLIGPFPARVELINELRKYYSANDALAPANLETLVDDWICHQIHPSLCENAETRTSQLNPPKPGKGIVAGFHTVVAGTLTIGEWFIKGRLMNKIQLVSPEHALARGTVCATQCTPPANPEGHNVPVGSCAACVKGRMTKAVSRIVGNASTPIDENLGACNLCGCSLKAKIWIPVDLLRKHMTADHLSRFPSYCWLVTEAQ